MQGGRRKVVGSYEIFINKQLGHGASGTVYQAINTQSKELVAIKMVQRLLKNNQSLNENHIINSLKEQASILNKINSEYVVGFREIIATKRYYYIVQQKCDTNLRAFLRKRFDEKHNILEQEAIDLMSQILCGYYPLLVINYIHRDIKPENILMKNGKTKLADFGFAKRIVGQNMLKTKAGTQGYLAPEIQNNQNYTNKSDIYSLGCILYELLYQRMLFKDIKSKDKIISRMLQIQKWDDWFPIDRKVSPACKDVIKRCLRFKQIDRIGWADLYSHQVFAGKVPNLKQLKNSLEHLISLIRQQIQKSRTTTTRYLIQKGLKKDKQIDIGEFTKFLMMVVPSDSPFTPELLKYTFENFDANKSGKVSFDEFLQMLDKHKKKIFSPFAAFELLSQVAIKDQSGQMKQDQSMTQLELIQKSNSNRAYEKLLKQIADKNIDELQNIYSIQDLNQTGIDQQNFQDFLINGIGLKLTKQECNLIFLKMDDDGNKLISMQQFTKYIRQQSSINFLKSVFIP